jgi:alanyl-tRNA synthetase
MGEALVQVKDTLKVAGVFFGHAGVLRKGRMSMGEQVAARIDAMRRQAIVVHHSATHLMHAALKQVLGKHVEQRGSLVAPDHLRFDFTHPRAVSAEEMREIERLVNREIRRNPESKIEVMGLMMPEWATALLAKNTATGCAYVGDFSIELCGGTTFRVDIGRFKIVSAMPPESALSWQLPGRGRLDQSMEGRFREVAGI